MLQPLPGPGATWLEQQFNCTQHARIRLSSTLLSPYILNRLRSTTLLRESDPVPLRGMALVLRRLTQSEQPIGSHFLANRDPAS